MSRTTRGLIGGLTAGALVLLALVLAGSAVVVLIATDPQNGPAHYSGRTVATVLDIDVYNDDDDGYSEYLDVEFEAGDVQKVAAISVSGALPERQDQVEIAYVPSDPDDAILVSQLDPPGSHSDTRAAGVLGIVAAGFVGLALAIGAGTIVWAHAAPPTPRRSPQGPYGYGPPGP
jgi:hypothetical protein